MPGIARLVLIGASTPRITGGSPPRELGTSSVVGGVASADTTSSADAARTSAEAQAFVRVFSSSTARIQALVSKNEEAFVVSQQVYRQLYWQSQTRQPQQPGGQSGGCRRPVHNHEVSPVILLTGDTG